MLKGLLASLKGTLKAGQGNAIAFEGLHLLHMLTQGTLPLCSLDHVHKVIQGGDVVSSDVALDPVRLQVGAAQTRRQAPVISVNINLGHGGEWDGIEGPSFIQNLPAKRKIHM